MSSELRAALPAACLCLLLQGAIVGGAVLLQRWILPPPAATLPSGAGS